MIRDGLKYLVTTDNWFIAPDGQSYKAAWGTCRVVKTEDALGFTPLRPSTNWYLVVGSAEREVIIAGCQLHYAVRSKDKPADTLAGKTYIDKDTGVEFTASKIYIAE